MLIFEWKLEEGSWKYYLCFIDKYSHSYDDNLSTMQMILYFVYKYFHLPFPYFKKKPPRLTLGGHLYIVMCITLPAYLFLHPLFQGR